MDIQLVSTAMS